MSILTIEQYVQSGRRPDFDLLCNALYRFFNNVHLESVAVALPNEITIRDNGREIDWNSTNRTPQEFVRFPHDAERQFTYTIARAIAPLIDPTRAPITGEEAQIVEFIRGATQDPRGLTQKEAVKILQPFSILPRGTKPFAILSLFVLTGLGLWLANGYLNHETQAPQSAQSQTSIQSEEYKEVISVGMPNLVGLTAKEAKEKGESLGFDVKVTEIITPQGEPGTVVAHTPASGTVIPDDKGVLELIVRVANDGNSVPSFVGMKLNKANEGAVGAGYSFDVTTVDSANDEGVIVWQGDVFDGRVIPVKVSSGFVPIPHFGDNADVEFVTKELSSRGFTIIQEEKEVADKNKDRRVIYVENDDSRAQYKSQIRVHVGKYVEPKQDKPADDPQSLSTSEATTTEPPTRQE